MSDPVRAVMCGCGGISGAWLKPISKMDNVELVGLVDLNDKHAKARADEYSLGTIPTGKKLSTMLKKVKPDVVFDCTVPSAHKDVTLTALDHGCHVLGEKPLAETLDDARQMVKAAEAADKLYAVIQNRRYDPRIRSFRNVIRRNKIGPLTTLNADFYIGAHFGGFRDQMKHVLLLDMAIHSFDQARLISGADPVSVYCYEWNPLGSWFDQDASAIAIFEMSDDIVFTYRGSWCAEGCNTTWECDWRAIGVEGSVTWDGADTFEAQVVDQPGGFFTQKKDLRVPIAKKEKQGGHGGIITEFIDCVQNGGTPETAASDNIKSLAMVLAAIESSETGQKVQIQI